jgi:hypothetical protein
MIHALLAALAKQVVPSVHCMNCIACRLHDMQRFPNALAYFAVAVSYVLKVFIKLTHGANYIKLFMAVSYGTCNKLERLSLASFSSLVFERCFTLVDSGLT